MRFVWGVALLVFGCLPVAAWTQDEGADPNATGFFHTDPGSTQAEPEPSDAEQEALFDEPLEWGGDLIRDRPRVIHPERWHFRWNGATFLEREDGRYRLLVSSRVILDASVGYLGGETYPPDPGFYADAEVRQARIAVQGEAWKRLLYRVEYDFATNSLGDVYFGLRRMGRLGTMLWGSFTEPFSLEQRISRANLLFMERSLANTLSPKQGAGIFATNTLFGRQLRWAASLTGFSKVLSDEENQNEGFDGSVDLTLRMNWFPRFEDEGRRMIEIGGSYSVQANLQEAVQYSQRPESNLAPFLLETPPILDVDSIQRVGIEFAMVQESFQVQGELIGNFLARGSGLSNLNFWGGYLQLSRFLTGEHRVYGRRSGVFGRVSPDRPFRRGSPDLGAVEVGLRLSYLDLETAEILGGRELNLGFAFNWYPVDYVRFSVNAIYGHLFDRGNVGILQTRFQVEF